MADFQLIPVVATVSGMTLLYCAAKNKKPVELIKAALSGGDINAVPPMFSGSGGSGGPGATTDPGNDGDAKNGTAPGGGNAPGSIGDKLNIPSLGISPGNIGQKPLAPTGNPALDRAIGIS